MNRIGSNAGREQGFTLMELLVVLLIIGILSTVALRTIDATRDRSLFDQTTKEMNDLVQAITGNPDLTYDGRRVDFGFYGDMGRLPDNLRELTRNPGDPNWHGPYIRQMVGGDTASYLYDGWGSLYTYSKDSGTIGSPGNGKYPMTVRIADTLTQLYQNTISGTITDKDDNPPGDRVEQMMITLNYSSGRMPTMKTFADAGGPSPGGSYEFAPKWGDTVPIGTHRLVVRFPGGDTLQRWVTVAPRSQAVVDFRYFKSFRNRLRMAGDPKRMLENDGFMILVVNDGDTPDTVNWVRFADAPDSGAYMRDFSVDQVEPPGGQFPVLVPNPGLGQGDTAYFTRVIEPNLSDDVELSFLMFRPDSLSDTGKTDVTGMVFTFRFSDGSEITVKP